MYYIMLCYIIIFIIIISDNLEVLATVYRSKKKLWASFSHLCVSVTKQYNLVLAKAGE